MQQNCIIVMGMHRSGTSATAGVLTKLNYSTTINVMQPHKDDNPRGYFEDEELVKINDEIFSSFGSNWHDITLDHEKIRGKLSKEYSFDKRIKDIIEKNYSHYERFIIKDPRLCLLFPLYARILQELNIKVKVIITYRDPIAISQSLQKRDGFSIGKGVALWFNYFFAAEFNSRKKQRVFINYDQLLEKTAETIAMVADYLELGQLKKLYIEYEEDINSFLDYNLRHTQSQLKTGLDYLSLYFEIDKCKNNLNKLRFDDFNRITNDYNKTKEIFYFSEVSNLIDNYYEELSNSLIEKDRLIAEKDRLIAEKNAQIKQLYCTKSWRLTKPLREINLAKRKILQINLEVKNKGGVLKVCSVLIKKFRKSGMKEVYARIKYVLSDNYSEWLLQYDTLNADDRIKILKRIEELKVKPLISVIMPVFDTQLNFLEEAIQSVQSQLYSNWELCIADDASRNPEIQRLLEKYSNNDERIKVTYRTQNGHISKASNSALELATGEFIALLDHDDVLPEHALYWVANEINKNPNVKLIYSDEDKIDEKGRRHDAYFKCEWNLDLFLSHNMYCHLGVYNRKIIEKIDGFRSGVEGAQDYDLVLRCLDHVDNDQIAHIPRVLYHWRAITGSTALAVEEKNYVKIAGEKALNDYLQRNSANATAESVNNGYRVKYHLDKPYPLVSLIIPTRNMVDFLRQCLNSIIEKSNYPNYEIIIIDNGSDDSKTLAYLNTLEKKMRVTVIRSDGPFNYSALNNLAVKHSSGEIIGLINNDIEVISTGWMFEMVSHACRPEVGAVGPLLLYPDQKIQHAGVIMGIGGVAGHIHRSLPYKNIGFYRRASLLQSFSAVTGACLFVRKQLYEEVGGLNEENLAIAFNDIDFCLKLKEKGYRNIWTPYAKLYHHESISRGTDETPEKKERFGKEILYMKQHWNEIINYDPAYSPNMTLNSEDSSLAWPPRVDIL